MAGRAWHGLIRVLIGPEPPSVRRWRSPQERRVAYAALGVATLALCVGNLVGIATLGQLLLAVPVVAPLPLAARYPMLGWRIGWLALLLAPLVPATWWGGWPWGPGQILALLGAFCLAGIRQQRPELGWMWALTLIPWWLWLAADVPDLAGPASATIVFTAAVIAVDSIGSRLRAQQALAALTERAEDERARRAVLEERTRIAREMHDVVAHHMSLIAVRAETAPYRLSGLPEPARPSSARSVRRRARRWRRCAGCSACCAKTSLPLWRHSRSWRTCPRSSAPPAGPGYRFSCRCRPRWARCPPAWACAPTGSCRNRCPTPVSMPPGPRSPCRWTMMPAQYCCGWPTAPAVPRARAGTTTGLVTG